MNQSRENTEKYMWYILKYHKDFNGMLSDEQCMHKIACETGGVNMVDFLMYKKELKEVSKQDIDIVLRGCKKSCVYG